MNGLDALQSAQFITVKGKRFALISAEEWETLIEWLEMLEDTHTVKQAINELKAAGGDRKRAGWSEWQTLREEIE